MSTLTDLLDYGETGDPLRDALGVIEAGIINQPRSLQRRIGPSEIGMACTACLAKKLAGYEETREAAWLPAVGTAVHAFLADLFARDNERARKAGDPARWGIEAPVYVGTVDGLPVRGTSDLFDFATGTVIDHKVVGVTTLRTAKAGPSPVYRAQVHLYGMGQVNAGHTVNQVGILYLPRNELSLRKAVLWSEPYDPGVARAALERADRLATNLRALASISEGTRDTWIQSLERTPGCFSCPRYPDWTPPPSRLSLELGITSSTDRKAA